MTGCSSLPPGRVAPSRLERRLAELGVTLPPVSFIIPHYNNARFLRPAVASCAASYPGPRQIIVVDDGSTSPDAAPALAAIEADFPDAIVLRQTNKRLPGARNAGLRAATGAYVQFLDADDLLAPGKVLYQVVHLLISGEKTVSVCEWLRADETGLHYERPPTPVDGTPLTLQGFLLGWERGLTIPPHAFLFPRSLLAGLAFDESLQGKEDWLFWCAVAAGDARFKVLEYPGAVYRQHQGMMTRARAGQMSRDFLAAAHTLERLYGDRCPGLREASAAWHAHAYAGDRSVPAPTRQPGRFRALLRILRLDGPDAALISALQFAWRKLLPFAPPAWFPSAGHLALRRHNPEEKLIRALQGRAHGEVPRSGPRLTADQCAVVLVHYNNVADTLNCLTALQRLRAAPAHIVVVDNGSDPVAVESLLSAWKNLTADSGGAALYDPLSASAGLPSRFLLKLSHNTGFSGGNNAALRVLLRRTACSAFWLLNNDAIPCPDALDALCRRLNERPDAGLCGSTLIYADSPGMAQCAAGTAFSVWTGNARFLRHRKPVAEVIAQPPEQVEAELGEIVGASLCIRRAAIEQCGLMDERYFLYYEDTEWSLRCRREGFRLCWAPASLVMHREGGTSGAKSPRKDGRVQKSRLVDYLSLRNRVFLIRTHAPWALPMVLASFAGVLVNRVLRHQTDRAGLVLRAASDGLRGAMGKPRGRI